MTAPPTANASDPERRRAEALKRLDSGFRPTLERFFRRRVSDSAEVDDLVQDVFVRLLARGDVENLEHIGGYVFQTASSVLTDRVRRRGARRSDAHDTLGEDHRDDAVFEADRVLMGKEALRRAALSLLELPERTRTIFVLRRLEGLPYQAIAQRLGVSLSVIEKEMTKAVRHLMQAREDET